MDESIVDESGLSAADDAGYSRRGFLATSAGIGAVVALGGAAEDVLMPAAPTT
ncbi:MAG TPA: twin-arginine translocation signal domain-containing protein [Actinospica sp.]|nr:twin-arginine translocation signal domain-containing protein [Actinospica sp.]